MHAILSALTAALRFRFRSRASLELEVIALRHQLAVLRRRKKDGRITDLISSDRFFWTWLYRIWPGSIRWMVLVKPETVIEWHRRGFLNYWRARSHRGRVPWKVKGELRNLIIQMYNENAGWGAGRIQGELLKLGYRVTKPTVAKYLARVPNRPPPGWRVFLNNHMHDAAATDMFVVFTASFRLLYAMVVLQLDRRRILYIDATDRPSQEWLSNGIERAFESNRNLKYLMRDRDSLYGGRFRDRMKALGIREHVISKQSPWQNVYVERVIGTIRRECLDHVIVFNSRHLSRLLTSYVQYYNRSRTHYSLDQDCPDPRPVQHLKPGMRAFAFPEVGGLHHRYEWCGSVDSDPSRSRAAQTNRRGTM